MTLSPQFEIQLVAIVVAVSCALPGVFLVLRRMAMMTDAITHTVLLGIILGFLIAGDVESPLLVIGATLVGVVTVVLVEMLTKTRRMSEDSAIGIIFPLLFSIAIVLISRYAGRRTSIRTLSCSASSLSCRFTVSRLGEPIWDRKHSISPELFC